MRSLKLAAVFDASDLIVITAYQKIKKIFILNEVFNNIIFLLPFLISGISVIFFSIDFEKIIDMLKIMLKGIISNPYL